MTNSFFFDSNTYFIDKNINYFKYGKCFRVFNENGKQIGFISEEISKGQKFLKNFVNKNILPFQLEIKDNKGNLQSLIFKGWSLMLPSIVIKDDTGNTIGFVKQKFKLFCPFFTIYNKNKHPIAEVTRNSKIDFFQINGSSGKKIGSINKNWKGDMYGLFSTADNYNVILNSDDMKLLHKNTVLLGALIIEKILK
tara:strand:+ start:793 stop:1377 length:585 start_codon:yes stop_codon:yes gene_type:complete